MTPTAAATPPVVRYMLLCDDVRPDADNTHCTHIDCVMGTIRSLDDPPFPHLRDQFCVYLVLTECYGGGNAQIRVAFVDVDPEQPIFGSSVRPLDFTGHTPLDLLGVVFRLRDCQFPQAGRYSVQLWYNGQQIEERPLVLR